MTRSTLLAACLATLFSTAALAQSTGPTNPTGPGPMSAPGTSTMPGNNSMGVPPGTTPGTATPGTDATQGGAIILNGADGKMKSGEGDDPAVPDGNKSSADVPPVVK